MKFHTSVNTASLSFSVVSLSLTNFVFAQNTVNNEILIYPPKKPPNTKKWFLPLEYGLGRFTTGLYSGLNRFPRRRVDADKLDPFADRPKPARKKESSSFKPGTWNWRPGRKPPAFSYKYRIINLTKDSQGSYEGMPGDYRQNYRPIPHVRFGGTFAPIPPLMGDPTQHRRGWYIKKYRETRPKKEQYNKYIMDIVNDKIQESNPSLEWVTYSWKNPYKWKYNLTKDKVRPRFGSYEAFSNYDSRFPAYEPKRRYEVIKIPEALPIHKRSAEKEDTPGKADKSININSVPSKSEDIIRNLQSASSIMQSALRTARLRQEPESVISSSDYDSNEELNSENSISLSSVYESSETNSSSSDTNSTSEDEVESKSLHNIPQRITVDRTLTSVFASIDRSALEKEKDNLIDSEDLRNDISPAAEDRMKMNKKSHNSDGKKSLLFNANRKQQQHMSINNMRHVRHKRSPLRKESIDKLAKKLNLSPKKEESKWTFKNMPSEAPELIDMSIFRLEDQVVKQKQKNLKMHHNIINSKWNGKHTRERYNKLSRKLYTAQDVPLKTDEKISDTYVPEPFVPPIQYQKQKYMHKEVKNIKNKGNSINKKLKDRGEVDSFSFDDEDDDDDDDDDESASVSAGEIEDLSDVEMPTACPKGELSDLWRKEFEENTSEMDSRHVRYTITPVMGKFIPPLNFEPDSFWDSIYGRTKEKKGSGSSSDSDSSSNSKSVEATMKPLITTMQTAPKAHPGIGLPQGVNEEPLMETRGKRDRARREKKKKKLATEEREERKDKKKRKGRTNFARDYSIEVPRADLKGMDAFRFPTFPPQFTSFVPPRPYKQPTPYVQPTIPPRPPPRRPYVRIAEVQQGKINNAEHTENNMFHLQNNVPHKVANSVKARIIKVNMERVQSDMLHVQSKTRNKQITGSRVDHTKHKARVNKDSADRIQSDMHNIKSSVYKNGKNKELFANIPHLHSNKGLHRSLGLPAVRRRNLERTLRFGDDRLYDSEENSENDKAEWSIGPPLNESEPVLNTEERNYIPEGAYQFPHFRNPNFDPDTAYDEHGVPIFMNPNYTEPTTLKGDRIFGLGRGMQQRHRLIGHHHSQIAHDLQFIAGNEKGTKSSSNIGKRVQDSQVKPGVMKINWVIKRQKRFAHNGDETDDYEIPSEPRYNSPLPQRVYHNDWESLELKPAPEGWPEPTLPVGGYKVRSDSAKTQYTYKPYVRRFLQTGDRLNHQLEQALHEQTDENVRKHAVVKRHATYPDYHDDHPYSRRRMGLYMPRPGDIRYLRQGLTVPPYQLGKNSSPNISTTPYDYGNKIIFKRSLNASISNNASVYTPYDYGNKIIFKRSLNASISNNASVYEISGSEDYDAGNATSNMTTTAPKNLTTIFSGYKYWTLAVTRIWNTKPYRGTIEPPEFPIPEWIQKAEYHAFSTKNKSSDEDSAPLKKKIFSHPVWQHYTLLPRHKNPFKSKKHHAPEQKKAEHDAFNAKIKSSEEISHSFNKKKKVSHLAWQHRTYVPHHTQHFETQNPRPPRKDGQQWNIYNEPFQRKKNKLPTRPTYKWKPWFAVNDPKPKSTRIPVTFRNYQSPVKFPYEPEVSESKTTKHKTYPPDFYIIPNASEYDYSVPGGWVDSEFERKRFRGYRPPGIPFDSYYQDYYSEYADWYLKRRHNRSDDYYRIMDEDFFKERGYNFTRRPHQRRCHSTKTPRPIVSMALKEFAEKMDKKFEKYLQQQFKHFPNTTNKNIFRDISAYLKAVKEDSLEMQTVGNIPFRLFHPPESFFHTSTREAIDTSSMERVLIHGLPAHPSEEAEMRRRRRRSKRNANPEHKKKKKTKFNKHHKQLKEKDDDKKGNLPQGNTEMLNSITEELKEQLVSDMNHRKANSDKQKRNLVANTVLKKGTDEKINNNESKAVPPIHLVKQLTEEIYNNLDKRYPLHKPALNSRVTVIRARPGEEDQFLPIQHAPIQVRLNKKTGEYQIRYINKNTVSSDAGSVQFVNGSVHEDKEQRKKLWQQFDEKLRNIRAGVTSSMMVTSTPVTTAYSSREKRTRKKRRRVVKKIVRVRRRRTTTPEPVSDDVKISDDILDLSDKQKQILVSSESKTIETDEISAIKKSEEKGKKKTDVITKHQKVGQKRKVTGNPLISTDVHREKKKAEDSIKMVPNTTQIHKTYFKAPVSSSEDDKNTYFTPEKPVHVEITKSPSQLNISTTKILFTVTSKPMLAATTLARLSQSHECRDITTSSFKSDLRNTTSYTIYVYSRYHSISTHRSPVTTARSPTTVVTTEPTRKTVAPETSDEFLMSSNESTERPALAATSKNLEKFEITTPIAPYKILKGTEKLETHRTTKSLASSEDLAAHTTTEFVRSSEEVLKLTTNESLKTMKVLTTPSQEVSIEENIRSLETLLSVSANQSIKDNVILIASTPHTITGGIRNFTRSEYGTGKPTDVTTDISMQVTGFTTFATTAPSSSAPADWPTISKVTTEVTEQPTKTSPESQSTMETTEQTTLLWRHLPTVVFKVYSTSTSTPDAKPEQLKQSSLHGEGRLKSGWYRYQPYSSRSLGSKYKQQPPVQPHWDNQWNRYSGRYNRGRKPVPLKYTWQRGRWLPADIPESATRMPSVMATISTEGTPLVEAEASTVKMKLFEGDTNIYEEQLTTLSFTEEQQTTVVSITEREHEKFVLTEEALILSSPVVKDDHTTLVSDRHVHVSSSYTPEKTTEPSETYTFSQRSVEKEHTTSVTPYPKFLTTSFSKENHTHRLTEYITMPTTSEVKDRTVSTKRMRFETDSSLAIDKYTVQPPFVKTYATLLDALEYAKTPPVSENYTTESLLPTKQQPPGTEEEHYITEFSSKMDTHNVLMAYTVMPSTHPFTASSTVAPTTVKEVYTTAEPLPQTPAATKQVPPYKGPKFEWPVFDIKNIFTTVSPLLGILSQSTHPHQMHQIVVISETPKVEASSVKHIDESLLSTMEILHDTGKSVVTDPIILTEKPCVTNQATISSVKTTTVSIDQLILAPTTEDEYSLLKVVPDTDLVSSEDGVLKKIFVNPFKAAKKFFKDSSESESQGIHYINYDESNGTVQYDFNDIYNEPYFDKNATKAYFTEMRFKGTYVTVRTIYRRPSNFTFPPTPPVTKKPTTQLPTTLMTATHKPAKLGLFGFMKHRVKKTFKNIAKFFTPDLSDEEEEMRRMRKNVMVSTEEDGEDEEH